MQNQKLYNLMDEMCCDLAAVVHRYDADISALR